ncbi:hypothetical protein QTO34_017244 [Cnephaeus nilssonii]|uniref:Protein BTG1 n=1 Tax=Cnephaeus nilssonii TaxID=3371016 RepID=A0AA40I0Q7_CNENI|nr:hypothetical protein QTO34_017244 [Eptesicus nilssonii]
MHPFYTRAATMIGEIAAAVSFISKFLRTKGLTSERQLQTFSQSLQELLAGEGASVGRRGVPEGCGSLSPGRAVGPREPGCASGRRRSGPAAGPGQARWTPTNGGFRRGFRGAGPRAPPLPTTGQWRGEENGTHNKETEAHRGGSRGPRTVRVSRDKGATGLGGGVLRPHPPPPNRPVRGDRPRVGPRRCPEPAWDGRAVRPGRLLPPINHRICHRDNYALPKHYKHHWFPEKPCKGSGYRCIRINHKMDPLIGQAAQRIGLSSQELFRLLPSELTLWVDPYEVSYRIGEDGSICVLYEASPAGGSTQSSSSVQMEQGEVEKPLYPLALSNRGQH